MLTDDERKTIIKLVLDKTSPDVCLAAKQITRIDLVSLCSALSIDYDISLVVDNPEYELVPVLRKALAERETVG